MNIHRTLHSILICLLFAIVSNSHANNQVTIDCEMLSIGEYQEEALQHINQIRSKAQICGSENFAASPSLTWNRQLQNSASDQAKDNASRNKISHLDQYGHTLKMRMRQSGYTGQEGGENITSGQQNMQQALMSWLKLSPTHCKTLMNPKFNEYAIACVKNPQTQRSYWIQHFGRQHDVTKTSL